MGIGTSFIFVAILCITNLAIGAVDRSAFTKATQEKLEDPAFCAQIIDFVQRIQANGGTQTPRLQYLGDGEVYWVPSLRSFFVVEQPYLFVAPRERCILEFNEQGKWKQTIKGQFQSGFSPHNRHGGQGTDSIFFKGEGGTDGCLKLASPPSLRLSSGEWHDVVRLSGDGAGNYLTE